MCVCVYQLCLLLLKYYYTKINNIINHYIDSVMGILVVLFSLLNTCRNLFIKALYTIQ